MSRHSPEQHSVHPDLKEIYPAEQFMVHDCPVEFHRVQHHIDVFNKNPEYFKQAIEKASIVVLEAAPTAEGLFTETIQKDYCKQLNTWGIKITLQEFQEDLANNKLLLFFKALEEQAAAQQKPVATVDPVFKEEGTWLLGVEDLIVGAKYGTIGIASLTILAKIAEAKGIIVPFLKKKNTTETMPPSRRSFLKTTVAGVGGILAGSSLSVRHGNDMDHHGRTARGAGVTTFDMHDYRDTIIAEGLYQVASLREGTSPIEAFYGAAHGSAVKFYAGHEKERRQRINMYADTVARGIHPKLHMYRYEKGVWEEKARSEIA